ncbi:MAG: PfkB family carbohydrate kinase [Dehalococcoidales bacterium]|jgi:rfaE bifunctional protein kinase chain/domain/rfaE bifunctional protein nucleotidyltransferase chain/domain
MEKSSKIKNLEELAKTLDALRAKKKKIVLCHGVFDLLHIGHIRHFEQARKLGDILVVTLTPDRFVNKGPHRPAFSEDLRAESIAALDCVNYVAINNWPTSVETIKLLKPDFYAKGSDYKDASKDFTGKIIDEEAAVRSIGGELALTDDITFSSSSLINKYITPFTKDVSDFLVDFTKRYSAEKVVQYLDSIRSLKVLVIGETIIDDYHYCDVIGKSTKEPVLAAQLVFSEKYAGGSLAICNNVANFCDHAGLLTFLGTEDSQEDFVRERMKVNVENMFLYKDKSPTIVKRRFIENYSLTKLFEVYVMNGEEISQKENKSLCRKLHQVLPQYDVVIVADYGHGMISKEAIEIICNEARFLAVNTQANAGNRGFNTILKYPRADFVSVAEHEIRLEFRNQKDDVRDIMLQLSRELKCDKIIVTSGKNGSMGYSQKTGFFQIPAFVQRTVDRVGAGDAVLSITALCVAKKVPMEVVVFVGNVVGAEAVMTVGNKTPIERASLYKYIVSLMK